jgi:hypothetical protein
MIRFRWSLVAGRWSLVGVWLIVLLIGNFVGFALLPSRLSNEFTVPGTDSETARAVLAQRFGGRDVGNYFVVAKVANSADRAIQRRLITRLAKAAAAIPSGRADPIQVAGRHRRARQARPLHARSRPRRNPCYGARLNGFSPLSKPVRICAYG